MYVYELTRGWRGGWRLRPVVKCQAEPDTETHFPTERVYPAKPLYSYIYLYLFLPLSPSFSYSYMLVLSVVSVRAHDSPLLLVLASSLPTLLLAYIRLAPLLSLLLLSSSPSCSTLRYCHCCCHFPGGRVIPLLPHTLLSQNFHRWKFSPRCSNTRGNSPKLKVASWIWSRRWSPWRGITEWSRFSVKRSVETPEELWKHNRKWVEGERWNEFSTLSLLFG